VSGERHDPVREAYLRLGELGPAVEVILADMASFATSRPSELVQLRRLAGAGASEHLRKQLRRSREPRPSATAILE
jgi:hypothetical protein